MPITLGEVILAARDKHPAFDKDRVGNGLMARWQTQYQRQLIMRAIRRNKDFLLQTMSIGMVPEDGNELGSAGAGQNRETPALDAAPGSIVPSESPAGLAIELVETATVVPETVATGSTPLTLVASGAGWGTNAFALHVVKIVRGTGAGQWRWVISNTADTLTISTGSDNYEWSTAPDATSIFRIVAVVEDTTQQFGAVVDFPLVTDSYGYAVKLSVDGTPYIDITAPVLGRVGAGVPLPPHLLIRGGTVHLLGGAECPLSITSYGHRHRFIHDFSCYEQDGSLYLCGGLDEWVGVHSIELKYVPIPPALGTLDALYLLPDSAQPALVDALALEAAKRVSHMGIAIDLRIFQSDAAQAEQDFLFMLSAQRRGRLTTIKA